MVQLLSLNKSAHRLEALLNVSSIAYLSFSMSYSLLRGIYLSNDCIARSVAKPIVSPLIEKIGKCGLTVLFNLIDTPKSPSLRS